MTDLLNEEGRAPGEGDAAALMDSEQGWAPDHRTPAQTAPERDHLSPLFAAGMELIPLKPRSKVPTGKWRDAETMTRKAAARLLTRGGNLGARLRMTDLVVDVDRHGEVDGMASLAKLRERFDLPDTLTVETGGGGLHFYLRASGGQKLKGKLAEYPGIDFKTHGGYVVAPGSVHSDTGRTYAVDPLADTAVAEAPAELVAALTRETATEASNGGELSTERLADMLEALDPVDFAGDKPWLDLAMACHHATGGTGEEVFIAWSLGDASYTPNEEVSRRRWRSMRADGSGDRITVATLYAAVLASGNAHLVPADHDAAADDFDGEDADIDNLPLPPNQSFWSQWVWVAEPGYFIRRTDGKRWTKEAWKSLYAHRFPEGDLLNAIWKGKTGVKRLEGLDFLPEGAEFLEGGTIYNLWRDAGVKAEPGDVSMFLDHMAFLFPDPKEREHVLDFLACLVQRPAEKINFALLVRGAPGTGKSWLGSLMEVIVGRPNVVRPSNDEVVSQWTAWMEAKQLAVVEELMALGRREVANRLKGPITDDTVRIQQKGLPLYSVPNRVNFLCFTNHKDALPIEDGDRRWLVVFSEATRRPDAYYEALFAYLDGGGPAHVKHWLAERPIALNPKGVAPSTRGKEEMRRRAMGDLDDFLQERLVTREAPFDFDLVRLEDVVETLPRSVLNGRVSSLRSKVSAFLERNGAVRHARYTKGGQSRPSYTLWSVDGHDVWADAGAAVRIDAFVKHQRGE